MLRSTRCVLFEYTYGRVCLLQNFGSYTLFLLPPRLKCAFAIGVYHPATLIGSQTFPMWVGKPPSSFPPKRKSLRNKKHRQDPRHTSARIWSGLGFSRPCKKWCVEIHRRIEKMIQVSTDSTISLADYLSAHSYLVCASATDS